MFLFVLIYTAVYFALIEKYKASLFAMLPAFLVYFLVAGLQFNVGTDYFSYIDIYENEERHWFYFNRGEYLFFALNQGLNWLKLPPQSIFIAVSFIQASLVFFYFKKIKNKGFILWLLFITFFCVTNIYNNQLNGIRQYVVIAGLPLFTILVYERKIIKSLLLLSFLSFFHNTAWLLLVVYPLFYLQVRFNRSLFLLFVASAAGYLFVGKFIYEVASLIFPSYLHYLQGGYAEPQTIKLFLTKLYYLPVVFYFYLIYKQTDSDFGRYFHYMVFLFTITYWFFLLALSLGIATRVYYYVIFFYLFPVYYVLHFNYINKRQLDFIFILAYVVLPYVFKVTVLAKAEFLYKSIL